MTPEEEVLRGNEAKLVLNNRIYKEALILIKADMLMVFKQTTFDQSTERDEIWRKMQVLDMIESQLESVMTTGKMGETTLKLENKGE